MEENSREAFSTPASDRRRRSTFARDLVLGVLVGTIALGAVYYLYLGNEEPSPGRTSQPTSTARAPADPPPIPEQRDPGRSGAANKAPAAPPPASSGSSEAQAPPSAPPPASSGSSEAQAPPSAPPPAERSAEARDQPSANEAASRPETAPADPIRDQLASPPAPEVAFVQRTRVNIRSEPNAQAKIVGRAVKGQQLTVLRRSGRWVQVDSGNGQGWVSGSMLAPQSP